MLMNRYSIFNPKPVIGQDEMFSTFNVVGRAVDVGMVQNYNNDARSHKKLDSIDMCEHPITKSRILEWAVLVTTTMAGTSSI